jgi:hypothetical protein
MLAPESVCLDHHLPSQAGSQVWSSRAMVSGSSATSWDGILGAGIAGFLAPRLGLYTPSTAGNIVAATLGAITLLF